MSRSTLTLDICTAAGWATDFGLGFGMEKEAAFLMLACARFVCAPRFARFAGAFFEQHKCRHDAAEDDNAEEAASANAADHPTDGVANGADHAQVVVA